MRQQWDNSFPGGRSREQGGTVTRDAGGNLGLVNIGGSGSTAGTFSPDLNIPSDHTRVGVFHTHPYDETEGGHRDVAFSGGDIANATNRGDMVSMVQSGDSQFMILRTAETPASVDRAAVNQAWNDRFAELQREGKSFSEASRIAAREIARRYGFAYYEGRNGEFRRGAC